MSNTSLSQDIPQISERRLNGLALASVLIALLLTLLLEALDQTVVGTALPKIIGSLQGFDRYSWAVTAYILASATLIPIVGKLSDQFGRKGFLIGGTALFLLGSVLSGASQNMNQLIVFRALQGLGAGIGIALAATVVGDIFPPQERAKWQGLFGAVYGISSVIGPSLGGWLADHGPLLGSLVNDTTRWRWVFYINLPIGIVALAMLVISLPANISGRCGQNVQMKGRGALRRIDFLGAALSATGTGLALTPLNVASVVGAMLASFAVMAMKRYRIVTVVTSLVLIAGVFLLTRMTATTGTLYVVLAMALAGMGVGTFFSVLQLAAQNSLPPTQLGVGTSFIRYASSLGGMLGLAIVGTVINSSLSSELAPRLARIAGVGHLPASVLRQATDPQTLISPDIRQRLVQGVAQHTPCTSRRQCRP